MIIDHVIREFQIAAGTDVERAGIGADFVVHEGEARLRAEIRFRARRDFARGIGNLLENDIGSKDGRGADQNATGKLGKRRSE